jgi:tetratricopeptide (TPR) repeat protein
MSSNSSPKQQSEPENLSPKEGMNFPSLRHRVAVPCREKRITKIEVRPMLLVAALAGGLMFGSAFAAEAAAPSQESAPALFNRGNALVREGKLGPAILAYERAQQLAPRDPAIAANLPRLCATLRASPPRRLPGGNLPPAR